MRKTEKNINQNSKVKIALGSKEVIGNKNYQGTGFIVEVTTKFLESGSEFDTMKESFHF